MQKNLLLIKSPILYIILVRQEAKLDYSIKQIDEKSIPSRFI